MGRASAPEPDLPAGDFSPWLADMRSALRGERSADVPCGDCTACCTSSQFIHIGPDETRTLALIPPELLFPAPGRPPGHVLLGYDERGHCPMLVDGACSVYEHRPRTCRTYDCRVFAAAGVVPDEPDKALIARRAERWAFDGTDPAAEVEREAVRAAAAFIVDHPDLLPGGVGPAPATRLAVLAVEFHDLFLEFDTDSGRRRLRRPDSEAFRLEALNRLGGSD